MTLTKVSGPNGPNTWHRGSQLPALVIYASYRSVKMANIDRNTLPQAPQSEGNMFKNTHFLMKPLTLVIHLLTNEDFRLISSVEVTEERLEDVMEEREESNGRVKSLLPLTSSSTNG